MSAKQAIDTNKLPQHVAIIMDGNGRWAQKNGSLRTMGHKAGVETVRKIVETATELGIKYLTLYTFSTENWNRPKEEVDMLMNLLVDAIEKDTPTLMKNNVKLAVIGDINSLPQNCIDALNRTISATKNNTQMTLILALSYSARWEITNAVKIIANKIKTNELSVEDINQDLINNNLATQNIPNPDLLIRTSGEQRISNFMLWQIAYTELYFTPILWPDFTPENFYEAILDYQKRQRRFGLTSEQILSAQ